MIVLIIIAAIVLLAAFSYSNRKPAQETGEEPTVESQKPLEVRQRDLQVEQQHFREEVTRYSHYYQLLVDHEKDEFMQRAWMFHAEKQFEARGFEEVSMRMRAIISAYAAQITFGLKDIYLVNFTTVIVYPEAYRSAITNHYHKGEANYAGAIVFSWKDLTDGHNHISDGVNLAIHEFAHALRLENVTPPDEFGFLDEELLKDFRQMAAVEMQRITATDDHLLREYGATNEQEFFAVCVENFFERPITFCEEHPDVYSLLTKLLKQDPLVRPIRQQEA